MSTFRSTSSVAARCRGCPRGRGVMSTNRSARGPFHDFVRCGGANADSLAPEPSAAGSARDAPAARLEGNAFEGQTARV